MNTHSKSKMLCSWLSPFLTRKSVWAPLGSGLKVSSLPSRCRMLSLLHVQEALSGSHFQTTRSCSFRLRFSNSARARHMANYVQVRKYSGVCLERELLAPGCWAAAQKLLHIKIKHKFKSSVSCWKKPTHRTLNRSMLPLIKETTLGGPHTASWVGMWIFAGIPCSDRNKSCGRVSWTKIFVLLSHLCNFPSNFQ